MNPEPEHRREFRVGPLLGGVGLIVVGLLFLLNNLGLIPANLANLWPLVAIAGGVWALVQAVARRRGGDLVGGMLLLGLGGFWLLANYGKADDRLLVPVVLISLGVGLLLRNLLRF